MYILVIEDNPDLVANLYDFLEPRGYVVDAAGSARGGLHFVQEKVYDAIILDLTLPDMDGLEVCKRLRDSGCDTPVLMLTARDTLDDKLEGFGSGADDYLVKPFAMQELDARLKALVRRVSGDQSRELLRLADLAFDPATLQLERDGRSISLSADSAEDPGPAAAAVAPGWSHGVRSSGASGGIRAPTAMPCAPICQCCVRRSIGLSTNICYVRYTVSATN